MMIQPTYSPCRVEEGRVSIDRKFHVGTCEYAERLETPITVLAPPLGPDEKGMDFVQLEEDDLPYRLEIVQCDGNYQLEPDEHPRIEALVAESDFVYGFGFETQAFARALGKPYIPIVEYNLRTQIEVARLPVRGFLRRAVRTARTLAAFRHEIRDLRAAHSVHCNGYPIFEQSQRFNRNCLLYLDSRMSRDMVIDEAALEERIADLQTGRRPRLIYSGRYEPMKGALDVIEVGLALRRRGVDFELDTFGQGSQVDEMRERIRAVGAEETIRVHEAIPYPELVKRSYESDLFVCCHVQDDPSCSYLEASGSGLPIAGYGNAMWRSFSREAGNGPVTRMGRPEALAEAIQALLGDPSRLGDLARRSRTFSLEHCFEREFDKRISALREHVRAA